MEEEQIATAGFVAEDAERTVKVRCTICTSGDAKEMSAYRAELSGILVSIGFVEEISKEFDVHQGHYQLGGDGLGAISKI